MKQFFITGSSSGIGLALAEAALAEGHQVTGISRRHVVQHENYKHHPVDLAKPEEYLKLNFNINKKAEALVLINNAGWLGEVKPLARQDPDNIRRAFEINVSAPAVLSKMFIEQNAGSGQQLIILNISSGAGAYPVSSWSTYCASKAALDIFTRVMKLDHPEVHCMAIAPGIVDTAMQGEIRRLESADFPEVQRFENYKREGQLSSPEEVAGKILHFIHHPEEIPDIVFSLRDVS